jgi:CheY-like chemotaxis protein
LAVLVVTSSAMAQDREEMTGLGFDGYFEKPLDYAAFLKLEPLVKGLLERGK